MVRSEGLSSSSSQANKGFAAGMTIMAGVLRARDESASEYNYAINPRIVGSVVEKS